jgi:hypothetical protein
VGIFSPADIAELRTDVQDDLAFADWYRLQAEHIVSTDSRGNRVKSWVVIEAGTCQLRMLNRQTGETIIADKIGWVNPMAIDLPWDTLAAPEHRLVIDDRAFYIGVINRAGALGMNPTALCEERSH